MNETRWCMNVGFKCVTIIKLWRKIFLFPMEAPCKQSLIHYSTLKNQFRMVCTSTLLLLSPSIVNNEISPSNIVLETKNYEDEIYSQVHSCTIHIYTISRFLLLNGYAKEVFLSFFFFFFAFDCSNDMIGWISANRTVDIFHHRHVKASSVDYSSFSMVASEIDWIVLFVLRSFVHVFFCKGSILSISLFLSLIFIRPSNPDNICKSLIDLFYFYFSFILFLFF